MNTIEILRLAEKTLTECSSSLLNPSNEDLQVGCAKLAQGVAAMIDVELRKDDPKPARI